jgi:hypothetical protein
MSFGFVTTHLDPTPEFFTSFLKPILDSSELIDNYHSILNIGISQTAKYMPHFIAGKRLSWKRFWTPLFADAQEKAPDSGFLENPESRWGKIARPGLKSTDQLTQASFVVLSGKPGSGKTAEVDDLEARSAEWLKPNEALIAFSCRSIDSGEALRRHTVDSTKWKQLISAGKNICLLIDGIDEGLKRLSVFVPLLTTLLKDEPRDRIRVILTCRSSEWDATAGSELAALWNVRPDQYLFELCPLRREEVELALRTLNLDPDPFFEAVYDNQIQSLAACPVTLRMLLDEIQKNGSLPSSHHELYEKAILGLCEEIDESRARALPQRPPTHDIQATAQRIAAVLLLTGKSAVLRGDKRQAKPTDLHWREILDASFGDVGAGEVEITEDLVKATLDTPLFGFRGHDRYGFDHQTFAEHLAAQFLKECSLRQIRNLLCVNLGGTEYVAPQLYETASRLALMHGPWRDYLTQNQPEVLLRADASPLNPEIKSRALAAFLRLAENEQAFDDRESMGFSHTLSHPGLASQLLPYIKDQRYNPVVRRIAFKIAGDSKVKSLEGVLWKQLLKNDPCTNYICHALREIGNKKSKQSLLKALKGGIKDDSVNDVKGMALRMLVPDILPVREILPYLTPQPDEHFYGSYESALRHHLPKHITSKDLPAIFRKLSDIRGCFDTLHYLHEFATKAFDIALEHLDDPKISKLCVSLWLKKKETHDRLPHEERSSDEESEKQGLGRPELKRKLAECILKTPGVKINEMRTWDEELLGKEDLEWLLRELPTVAKKSRKLWAQSCVQFLWWDETEKHRDLFLQRYAEVEELRNALPSVKRYPIDVTMRRLRKAGELRRERRRRHYEGKRRKHRTRVEWIEILLKEAVIKNYSSSVRFCEIAHLEDKSDPIKNYPDATRADITTSPGWRQLNTRQKNLMGKMARGFLLKYSDRHRPRGRWSNYSDAGYHAIQLLEKTLRKDAMLRRAVEQKWTKSIFDHLGDSGESHERMMVLGYKLAPSIARKRFREELIANGKDGYPMCIQRFESCWDNSFLELLAKHLLSGKAPARLVRETLYRLADFNREDAHKLLVRLLKHRRCYAPFDELGRALLAASLLLFPQMTDRNPWTSLAKLSKVTAKKMFLESVSLLSRSKTVRNEDFTDSQLATLAIRLRTLFPPDEYDARHGPDSSVAPKHEIPEFRDRPINSLVVRATESSLQEIMRVAQSVPEKERIWIKWRHEEAKRGLLRTLWTGKPHAPGHVVAMGRDLRKLSVFTSDDLMEAVMDSLERLQNQVSIVESSEHMALWNEVQGKMTPKTEKTLSDMIIAWLSRDLGKTAKIILNREVQASRLGRLDIKVEAFGKKADTPITVVVEVKGSWNREIPNAVKDQLVGRYLDRNQWTHGIFLVGWFGNYSSQSIPSFWATNNFKKASAYLESCVTKQHGPPHHVKGVLLNCSNAK